MAWSHDSPDRPPHRRTSHLRTGRVSLPGATYFVTAVTKDRAPVLAEPAVADRVCDSLAQMEVTGDLHLFASTVMPDHVHLLFELGERLTVGETLAKLKTLARDKGRASWRWQQDQFEHRLRPNESTENYGLYIFLNPYRAELIKADRVWRWWRCPKPERFRFMQLLRDGGLPQPEWFGEIEKVERELHVGELPRL